MWMKLNLQMEYVDKAQTKLKIIEYVLGVKSLQELREKAKNAKYSIQHFIADSLCRFSISEFESGRGSNTQTSPSSIITH
ncbi:hypothetical protein DOY81_010800 [Sarcophaga bullata]|nr:hypothetical protein DOY81_010800 [Sarcophaga bullata]